MTTLVALALVLVGAGCQKKQPAPGSERVTEPHASTPAKSAAPLRVAFNQWVGFAGLYLADERKLFEKHGLTVKLVPFSGPGDSIPPLLAGQIDLSLTTANNLALIAGKQQAAAKITYMIDASDGADAIVARSAIKSVAELKGKTVAVTKGEINHMLLMLALESANLKEEALKLVDMSPDDAGAAFMAGKVDAAVTWEPWVTRAKEKNGHIIYSSKEPGARDTLIDVMAASDSVLAQRKADLQAFIAAFDEGVTLLKTEPDAARAILAKRLEAKPADVDGMLSGAKIYTRAENEKLLRDVLPNTLGKVDSFLKTHALITRNVTGAELISTALLQ